MKSLIIKSFRTIGFNKIRYLGALLLILLSSALFTAFRTSGYSINDSLYNFWEINNLADVSFEVKNQLGEKSQFSISEEKLLNSTFEKWEKRYYYDNEIDDGIILRTFSITDRQNIYQLTSGEKIIEDNEILIDHSFASYHDIEIGDFVVINSKTAYIVGFFALPDYITVAKFESEAINSSDDFGIALTQNIDFWNTSYNTEYLCSLADSQNLANKEEIYREFQTKASIMGYNFSNWLEKEFNGRITNAQGDVRGFIEIGQILPIFILLVASFMLAIIISRQLIGEENVMGIFYAVGYKKTELVLHYLILPLLLVSLGTLIGGLLGFGLARGVAFIETMRYNFPIIVYSSKIFDLLIVFGIAFFMILPVTLILVLRALRQRPLELMRGHGRRAKVSKIEKFAKIEKLNFRSKFFIRDILRNFGRHMILFAGMLIAGMLLMLGMGIIDSINNIENDINRTYEYNHIYNYGENLQFDEVKNGEDYLEILAVVYNGDISRKANLRFMNENAKGILQNDGESGKKIDYTQMAVSFSLAKKLKIKKGDEIKILHKSLPFEDWIYKVDIITDYTLGDMIFFPKDLVIEKYNENFGIAPNQKIENIYNIILSENKINGLENASYSNIKEYMMETIDQVMGAVTIAIIIIGFSAVLVAVILLQIVVELILEENKHNIALFKMFGYTSSKVNGLILNGGILFAGVGLLLAYPLDKLLIGFILTRFTQGMNVLVVSSISWVTAIVAYAVAIFVYGIARAFATKKILKIPISEALKNNKQ